MGSSLGSLASAMRDGLLLLGFVVAVTSLGGCGGKVADEPSEVVLTSGAGGGDEGGEGGSTSLAGAGAENGGESTEEGGTDGQSGTAGAGGRLSTGGASQGGVAGEDAGAAGSVTAG